MPERLQLARPHVCWLQIDAYGQDPSGSAGQSMADDMRKKIEKWQEPPPAKQQKVRF